MEAATTNCINCRAELPRNAAFCMKCGSPQRGGLRRAHLVLSQGSHYLLMRLTTFVLGIVFMGMLLWIAITDKFFSWSDASFWTAVIVIIVAFGVIPQVLWRRKPGSPAQRITAKTLIQILAGITVGATYGLVLWWGVRISGFSMVSGGVSPVTQITVIGMTVGNAVLSIILAYTLDKQLKRRVTWDSVKNQIITLVAVQISLNIIAEIVWRMSNR